MNKKFKYMSALALSFLLAVGTSSANQLANVEKNSMAWQYVGSLPAQKGFEKNHGVAGLLQGVIGDYIIVGGGANFPVALEKGGAKVTHKDLYLLKEVKGELKTLNQIQLDYPIGYGASVDVANEKAIYYLGGSPDKDHAKDVLKVTLDGEKIKTEVVAKLPYAFQNGVAQYKDGKIYFGVGKVGNDEGKVVNSNRFFVYDIKAKVTKELKTFPGEPRQQTVGQILNDKFYVFSGGSNVSYTDGYAYDFKTNTWTKLNDVVVDGEKLLLLGANSIKLSDDKMMVIGGFNYKLWNDANHFLSTLKDQAKEEYKKDYFGAEPDSYGWNRKVLVYSAKEDKWESVGEVPFNAPCGEALVRVNDFVYSINGEIKPGVRTERMFKGFVLDQK